MNRTRKLMTAAGVVALCGVAGTVVAQDSVGTNAGSYGAIVGDALLAHDLATQCRNYTVDLGSLITSWNNEYGIAPIAKTNTPDEPEFFNGFISNQSLSQDLNESEDISANSYSDWAVAGEGVNPTLNAAPAYSVSGPTNARQLAYVFAQFGGPGGLNNQNASTVGGFINWETTNPGRLYVSRVQTSVNNQAINTNGSSTNGIGMVDADGNIVFRADGNNMTGASALPSANVFRVSIAARDCGAINWISNLGGSDASATERPITGFDNTVPNMLPASLAASGNGRVIVGTFNMQLITEQPVNTPVDNGLGHLNLATDNRGAPCVLPSSTFGGASVATGAILSKPTHNALYTAGVTIQNSRSDTLGISVWGIGSDSSITHTAKTICLPWALSSGPGAITDPEPIGGIDPDTGVAFTTSGALNATNNAEFIHSTGQTPFNGPVSQVGMGRTPSGALLLSATFSNLPLGVTNANNPSQTIGVARVTDITADPPVYEWVAAGWTTFNVADTANEGKGILDGPGGNIVARMCPMNKVSAYDLRGLAGPTTLGPSIGTSGFDSEGNIYFVAPVQIKRGMDFDDLDGGTPPPDALIGPAGMQTPNPERDRFEFALVRGNLVETMNDFYYELELLMATGDEFTSKDTGLKYQIQFLSIVNAGGQQIASQTFDSGNVTKGPGQNGDPFGGLIIEASICYDNDGLDTVDPNNPNPNAVGGDGVSPFFDFPVEVGGSGPYEDISDDDQNMDPLFPNSSDQAYRVLLFIGNGPSQVGACCVGPQCVDRVTADQCTGDLGGVYQGDDTDCSAISCETVGACCFGCVGSNPVLCQELSLEDCCLANGVYAGDATTCAGDPCNQLPICIGDLDGDGDTDVFDFNIFAPNFGLMAGATRCSGDLNCDGVVDVFDFNLFAPNFGCMGAAVPNQCCSAP